jgi:hypothetical protein
MKIYDVVPLGRLSAAEDGGGDPADAFGVCDRVDLDDLAQQVSSSRRPSIQTSRGMPGTVGPEPSTNPQRSAEDVSWLAAGVQAGSQGCSRSGLVRM